MDTLKSMIDEIKRELSSGNYELDELRDNSGEWVDGYLPVYNNRIIEEWQSMPSEYDNRGAVELGHLEQEINIVNLMTLDLYLYYSDLWNEALNDVETELDEASL